MHRGELPQCRFGAGSRLPGLAVHRQVLQQHGHGRQRAALSPDHECFGHVLTRGLSDRVYRQVAPVVNEAGKHDTVYGSSCPGPYRLGFDGLWAAYNFNHRYYENWYHRDTAEKLHWGKASMNPTARRTWPSSSCASSAGTTFALFLLVGTPHDPDGDNVPPVQAFKDVEFPLPETGRTFPIRADRFTDRAAGVLKPRIPFPAGLHAMTAI